MTAREFIDHYMPSMDGWCSADKANAILNLVAHYQPRRFVEIGVFAGRSLFAATLAMMEIARPGQAIGIDPWDKSSSVEGFSDANKEWWGKVDHEKIYQSARKSCQNLKISYHCTLIRKTSAEALTLIRLLNPIDMLHIDGNHSELSALFDVQNYVPLVRRGFPILFDDADWTTTKQAQTAMESMATKIKEVGNCHIFVKN